MCKFKRIAIVVNVLMLVACNGVQTPTSSAPSNTQSNNQPTIVSGQLLADGSVYIATANPNAQAKSALMPDGSVYVVSQSK